ncbi:MAG: glycosyltransferase family 4 protein [Streptosporangiaceae bacterium]
MTRPRVAFVLGSAAGGTATHVAMLAGGCRRSGLDVCAFGPRATRELFPESAGIVFRPVEISARPRPVHDAIAVTRLRGLLGRLRPGVVHAHGLRAGAIAALALLPASARGLAPPLVVTVHNAAPGGRLPDLIYRLLEAVVARRSAMVLCASRDLAVRMRALGARKADLAVVPARRRPAAEPAAVARARAGIAANEPVVLASGRLARQKGIDVLLTALSSWPAPGRPPLLVVAGEGPLRSVLARQADAAALPVRFLGQRDDIEVLLAMADVVAVPSRWEGQPLIVQETLQAGRPLIASRVGGIPDLTGDEAALLVPPEDPCALADALAAVLGDPALAARLSAAALARAAALPTEADAVDAVLAVYRGLGANARAGTGQHAGNPRSEEIR